MIVFLRFTLWFVRVVLLLLACWGLLWAAPLAYQFVRGGLPAVEGLFYWHMLVMGVPLEQQSPLFVVHLAHRFYLGLFLLLTFTEILILLHWQLGRVLKQIRMSGGSPLTR